MRVSKETAAAHRGAIVAAAGRLFRRHGFAGVGIAEITREAGLTHGGFYGHFASKDALAVEAITAAFAEGRARLEAAPDLATYLARYVSRSHRDTPEDGCVMVALAGDIGRCDAAAQRAWSAGVDDFVEALARRLADNSPQRADDRARATALLAQLVGGMALARATARGDTEGSDRMVATLRAEVLRSLRDTAAAAGAGSPPRTVATPAPPNR